MYVRKPEPPEWQAPDGTAPLVVGVGASRGVSVEEVLGLVVTTLREAGLAVRRVRALATVDAKADEPGLVETARRLGVPLVCHPAERLAGIAVPNPSAAPAAALGTPSVAEAAALADGGELLVPKRASRPAKGPSRATCAVARTAQRTDGSGRVSARGGVDPATVDMMSVVTAGATATRANPRTTLASDLAQREARPCHPHFKEYP